MIFLCFCQCFSFSQATVLAFCLTVCYLSGRVRSDCCGGKFFSYLFCLLFLLPFWYFYLYHYYVFVLFSLFFLLIHYLFSKFSRSYIANNLLIFENYTKVDYKYQEYTEEICFSKCNSIF